MKVQAALVAVVLAAAGVMAADQPSLEVNLDPQRLGVEDLTRLTVRIVEPGNDRPQADLGQLVNFDVVQGPSTETQFSWVNGRSTSAVALSWILKPSGVGSAVVGPITVRLGAKELAGGAVTAEVVPGSLAAQQRVNRPPGPFGGRDPLSQLFGMPSRSLRQPKVALRQIVSRPSIIEGQPIAANVVLDATGGGIEGFEWVDVPEYPGWWVHRLENPQQLQAQVAEVDGVKYNRFVVARYILIPLKHGTLTIPAATARIGLRSQSVFSPPIVQERSTGTVDVEVKPRPAPPAGFSGAVGDFSYSAEIKPKTIKLGESAVVTITLSGSGNLPLVDAPAVWPTAPDCETYPPEEDDKTKVDEAGIHGTRQWRMTLVPQKAGVQTLSAVELAVYRPDKGVYTKQKLGPLRLEVTAPPPTPTPTPVPEAETVAGPSGEEPGAAAGQSAPMPAFPVWVLVGSALLIGVAGGGLLAWVATRRRNAVIPARRAGQTPPERARELQAAMERWWTGVPEQERTGAREAEMQALRKALETIRFAPSRADHSDNIRDLERRIRTLVR